MACVCFGPPTPEEALEESAMVFLGTVVRLEAIAPDEPGETRIINGQTWPDPYDFYTRRALLRLERFWKGPRSPIVVLETGLFNSCAFDFDIGRRYLVYVHESDGALSTSICTRTKRFNIHIEDLKVLGKPAYSAPNAPRFPCF
jgi:hypothetical protein